jgi:cell division septation protein DedD
LVQTACNGTHLKAQQTLEVHQSVAALVVTPPLPIAEHRDSSQWFVSHSEQDYSSASPQINDSAEELISEESVLSHQSLQAERADIAAAGFPPGADVFTEASESAPMADSELPHIDAENQEQIAELTDTSPNSFTGELPQPPALNSPTSHSQEEWPVLMVPARRRSFSKARASMVILTLVASVAAVYFLIYMPLSSGKREKAAASRSAREVSNAVVPAAPETANPAGAEPTRISESQLEAATSAKQEPSIADARGQFSLQAAAFPVETGAAEFAEKLKHAGLPSYVVSADVAKRGRWYRVRVGRFETAEQAKRYSAEAQLRSKALGVSLQLIVCQYEQP